MNKKIAVEKLRKAADGYFKKYDGPTSKDESYKEMLLSDVEDLRLVANLIEEGNLKTARIKAQNLDTAVRDEIPSKVWEYLWGDED